MISVYRWMGKADSVFVQGVLDVFLLSLSLSLFIPALYGSGRKGSYISFDINARFASSRFSLSDLAICALLFWAIFLV